MSDKALRAGLIRLAHSHPEFRKELLPLLKEGAGAAQEFKSLPEELQNAAIATFRKEGPGNSSWDDAFVYNADPTVKSLHGDWGNIKILGPIVGNVEDHGNEGLQIEVGTTKFQAPVQITLTLDGGATLDIEGVGIFEGPDLVFTTGHWINKSGKWVRVLP